MIKHYIIMSSAYSIGTRIALDFSGDSYNMNIIQEKIKKIYEKCGKDISLSTHFIQTDSLSFDSVIEYDPFFQNVKLLDHEEEFINFILKDRILIGTDIAKYILSVCDCCHLKLEKLVYLCYADYLCSFREKLFVDTIYAYRLGPVVKSVYEKYQKYGYEVIPHEKSLRMASRSRILASQNGVRKIVSIEDTLKKYRDMTALELVEITHRKSSPWSKTISKKDKNKKIPDEAILKYHSFEENKEM